jgi:hypothetical protein
MQPSSTVMLFVQFPRVVPSRDEIQCLASVPTLLRDDRKEKRKNQSGNTERRAEVHCSKVAQNW